MTDATLIGRAAVEGATPPYGPVAAAFRSFLRAEPDGLRQVGPLSDYLALILPELGSSPEHGDGPTLFEAIRYRQSADALPKPPH